VQPRAGGKQRQRRAGGHQHPRLLADPPARGRDDEEEQQAGQDREAADPLEHASAEQVLEPGRAGARRRAVIGGGGRSRVSGGSGHQAFGGGRAGASGGRGRPVFGDRRRRRAPSDLRGPLFGAGVRVGGRCRAAEERGAAAGC